MKSPRWLSSSSPIGVSSEIGSLAILRTIRTLSTGMLHLLGDLLGVGLAAELLHEVARARISLLIVSIMCTGMRIVRA